MYLLKRAKMPLVFLLFLICSNLQAQQLEYNFNQACIEASKSISQLKLKQATILLNQERLIHPNNVVVDYLENYIDFYTLITSQDIDELHRLEKNKAKRIERLGKLPNSSPYKLYAQSEIELQWAFTRIFHQEYFTAAIGFRDAYNLLEKNTDLFPFFNQNYKNKGMLKAMLGTIPDNFQWILTMIGMKGDFKQGMDLLENFVLNQSYSQDLLLDKQTAEYYYIILELNFGDKAKSWTVCERATRDFETNLLSNYLRSFVAIKTAHNEQAIEVLNRRPVHPEIIPFVYLDYLLGIAYLNKQHPNAAIYFKKYVSFSKGKNLIKDAYKKLSWHYLLEGDIEKFNLYQNMILKFGLTATEEDKIAQKEALAKYKPNPILLKSRLLFDGGYYEKALQELIHTSVSTLSDKLELTYRYGRIYSELKQYQKAIEFYSLCIKINDPNLHLHFAPTSAYQLGIVYESLGNKTKAIEFYKKSLTYKNYDYKTSLNLKTKQALQRLGNME